jgi:formate dehydrogenase subunit delta
MSDADLVRMANQIAANTAHLPPQQAAAAVANHLRMFWAPAMRTDLTHLVLELPEELDPLVLAAVEQLHATV